LPDTFFVFDDEPEAAQRYARLSRRLIHFLEANFLNPKIMGSASKIHPVVVVFALIAGENAYGIAGALLAVPAASILQSCFRFFVLDRQLESAEGAA